MVVLIFMISIVTYFTLNFFNNVELAPTYDRSTNSNVKAVTNLFAICFVIISMVALTVECIDRFDIWKYDVFERVIIDDHWLLSSLAIGSLIFLITKLKRTIMISRETPEERVLREEKETKKRELQRQRVRERQEQEAQKQQAESARVNSYTELRCPKCQSTNLTANTKGFGLGKAAAGGILLGPVGLLGGLIGSKKPVFVCLKCGNQFEK